MRVRAVKIFSSNNDLVQAAPLLVLLLAHQHLGQDVPGIEVRPFSDHILSLSKFSPSSLNLQVHRAALAAHAQAEGRLEEQERREQGLKDEVPGIQVKSSFCLIKTILTRA